MKRQKAKEILARLNKIVVRPAVSKRIHFLDGRRQKMIQPEMKVFKQPLNYPYQMTESPW